MDAVVVVEVYVESSVVAEVEAIAVTLEEDAEAADEEVTTAEVVEEEVEAADFVVIEAVVAMEMVVAGSKGPRSSGKY